MSEELLREIIGLAEKSKWNRVKKFINFIIQKTLKKEAGYQLTALDASINGKKRPKYDIQIRNKENIKEIDKITDFNHLALYQATPSSNNFIDISQKNGTIIVLAKYLGPTFNNHQVFDFSVHLDALEEPFFTIGNGKKINSSEVLKIINNKGKTIIKTEREKEKKETREIIDAKTVDLEAFIFKELVQKNPIWNGTETKTFQNWRAKIKNKYHIESGKIPYYKGKPTRQFSAYLEDLIKKKDIKKGKPTAEIKNNKVKQKKEIKIINEEYIFETLTSKNAIWNGSETKIFQDWKKKTHNKYRKETGKHPYYKGSATNNYSQYLENLIKKRTTKSKEPKKKYDKKPVNSKKDEKSVSEQTIFEALTGKNAIWKGSETQNFQTWKQRINKKYKKEKGKNPYYRGELTQNFKNYLKSLIK
ncbi:MAG: hypothetical protein JSV23_07955 [Promethearchaeota archaeon]|nr:MAG: hypothetical protein JSV23_07955 [Candidatus Lokiarchaeota archaeon]